MTAAVILADAMQGLEDAARLGVMAIILLVALFVIGYLLISRA